MTEKNFDGQDQMRLTQNIQNGGGEFKGDSTDIVFARGVNNSSQEIWSISDKRAFEGGYGEVTSNDIFKLIKPLSEHGKINIIIVPTYQGGAGEAIIVVDKI